MIKRIPGSCAFKSGEGLDHAHLDIDETDIDMIGAEAAVEVEADVEAGLQEEGRLKLKEKDSSNIENRTKGLGGQEPLRLKRIQKRVFLSNKP